MAFLFLFTICSFFSFNPKSSAFLEEPWFSNTLKENEARWVVSYTIPSKKNLQNYWIGLFFQKLFQDELNGCSYVAVNSPPSSFSIELSCPPNNYDSAKEELSCVLEKIKFQGFSDEKLEKTKEEAKTFAPLAIPEKAIIDKIEVSDFSPIINTLSLEELKESHSKLANLSHVTRAEFSEFKDLPINEREEELIYKIISTMAEKNPIQLAFEKTSLKKKGKKIHHVHPFRFLAYVFSHTYLKSCMHDIRKSHFKWNGFIDGYSKKMRNEAANDNLLPYIKGFAEYLKVDENEVKRLVNNKDYEGLVKFLL